MSQTEDLATIIPKIRSQFKARLIRLNASFEKKIHKAFLPSDSFDKVFEIRIPFQKNQNVLAPRKSIAKKLKIN